MSEQILGMNIVVDESLPPNVISITTVTAADFARKIKEVDGQAAVMRKALADILKFTRAFGQDVRTDKIIEVCSDALELNAGVELMAEVDALRQRVEEFQSLSRRMNADGYTYRKAIEQVLVKERGHLSRELEEYLPAVLSGIDLGKNIEQRLEAAERVCEKAVTWAQTRHTTEQPDPENCPGCKATGALVDELEVWVENSKVKDG